MVILGLSLFAVICLLIILAARIAERTTKASLHQSLVLHSSYVRYLQDKHDLNKMGFAQQLTRYMGGFTSFSHSFSALSVASGAAYLLGPAVAAGGPEVIGIGWPILAIFGLCTACSLAALASAFPAAGSLFHWTSSIGNRRLGLLSGLLHCTGNILLLIMTNLLLAGWINQIASASFHHFMPAWTFYFVLLILLGTQYFINVRTVRGAGKLLQTAAWLQAFIVLFVVIGLSALVWPGLYPFELLFLSHSGLERYGISVHDPSSLMAGMLILQRMFVGADHAAQAAEETHDPRISVPWSIYLSVVYTFLSGLVLFTVMLLQYPIGTGVFLGYEGINSWFTEVWKEAGGFIYYGMILILAIVGWSSGLSSMSSASRTLYAMARNDSIPFARLFKRVSERFRSPQVALLAVTVISAIIGVLSKRIGWNPFTSAALIQWAGISIIILHLSYVIPIGSKLAAALWGRKPVPLGPWHLGRAGWIIDAVSLIWLLVSTGCVVYYMELWLSMGIAGFVMLLMLYAEFKTSKQREYHTSK